MNKKTKGILLFSCYFIAILALLIYSYGFVDFNLTLSSHPLILKFITWVQQLTMFNRHTSNLVYLGLTKTIFIIYILIIWFWQTHKFTHFPWKFTLVIAFIASLAYPFLSSDVFKYLFAGRMVVDYGLNPHLIPPNHIMGDDWLRFLRWIHTPSPYGPLMTLLAIIFYLLGMGKFVSTLYLFKLAQVFWYALAIYYVGKLSFKIFKNRHQSVIAQLIFALNPLIIIEWLVNAHNDAPMISLLLLAIYLFMSSHKFSSFFALILSIAIKYITVLFLPFIFLHKKLKPKIIIFYLLATLTLAPLLYHYSFQYQPWYVTWLIPLMAILPISPLTYIISSYSYGSLLRYIPFISTGLWGASPLQFALYSFTPPLVTSLFFILAKYKGKL